MSHIFSHAVAVIFYKIKHLFFHLIINLPSYLFIISWRLRMLSQKYRKTHRGLTDTWLFRFGSGTTKLVFGIILESFPLETINWAPDIFNILIQSPLWQYILILSSSKIDTLHSRFIVTDKTEKHPNELSHF